jgi:hypothetical protein
MEHLERVAALLAQGVGQKPSFNLEYGPLKQILGVHDRETRRQTTQSPRDPALHFQVLETLIYSNS